MSGFAAAFGKIEKEGVIKMAKRIRHRGPYIDGLSHANGSMLFQNYLRADIVGPSPENMPIPFFDPESRLRICYDGLIGNKRELMEELSIESGVFEEERVLLALYSQYGTGMLKKLQDAVYAFVISDEGGYFSARDLLGIKTLFYGQKNGARYFTSELKSLLEVTDDVNEFPPGHFMDHTAEPVAFAYLPSTAPEEQEGPLEDVVAAIRRITMDSVRNRVELHRPTACLLSGGLDSSIICVEANKLYRETFGEQNRMKTFSIGFGASSDIQHARIIANHIGSDHVELVFDIDDILKALPQVIYYLESFDPSLVRSSVANYLISRAAAAEGFEVLLSGEGGDELFCGYAYLKGVSEEDLFKQQIECLSFLHNNASLRLDRMNACHSIRVVAPLISGKLLDYSLSIPPKYKIKDEDGIKVEKWIFRKAYEEQLPESIVWRVKQEFSQGSGSAAQLIPFFDNQIGDEELKEAQQTFPMVRSKEELHYFRLFEQHFGVGKSVDTVGQWVSL
jgi:asparagine synthase (glutamine-hydrolysing)